MNVSLKELVKKLLTREADTSVSNVTIQRNGRMRMLTITGITEGAINVATLPAKDRPPVVVKTTSRIYNGSTYTTAVISISTAGLVQIQSEWGGAISGAQLGFLQNQGITYMV